MWILRERIMKLTASQKFAYCHYGQIQTFIFENDQTGNDVEGVGIRVGLILVICGNFNGTQSQKTEFL